MSSTTTVPSSLIKRAGFWEPRNFMCRLSRKQHFNWALTGPVIVILAVDCVQDCGPVRLGCTWMLGLYQSNLCFRVLVIILNSQQGTFLFIVHCALNKEVREEYMRWLTCSFGKDRSVRDAPSISEDLDKEEGKK